MKQIPFAAPATLALAMVFALSACDDRRDDAQVDDAANPPPVATEPAPTAMPDEPMTDANAPVRISSVDLGSEVGADNRVAAPMAVYTTSDDIHASVATDGTGGTVTTVWTFEDGQVVPDPVSRFQQGDVHGPSEVVDPTFRFMSVDWDGRIRMDPSSPYAPAAPRQPSGRTPSCLPSRATSAAWMLAFVTPPDVSSSFTMPPGPGQGANVARARAAAQAPASR